MTPIISVCIPPGGLAWTESHLAWKLAQVLRGWSSPSLLKTASFTVTYFSVCFISSFPVRTRTQEICARLDKLRQEVCSSVLRKAEDGGERRRCIPRTVLAVSVLYVVFQAVGKPFSLQFVYQSVPDLRRIHERHRNSLYPFCNCGSQTPEMCREADYWTENAPTYLRSRSRYTPS